MMCKYCCSSPVGCCWRYTRCIITPTGLVAETRGHTDDMIFRHRLFFARFPVEQ